MSDNIALELELRRLVNRLRRQASTEAAGAAADVAIDAADQAGAKVDEHAQQRQFVHGVGPLYVAKTSRPDQFVDWKDLRGVPPAIGSGGIDPETLELDGTQITTGTVPLGRLPVAEPGEVNSKELVRADDPRLTASTFVLRTSEYLGAGDFVNTHQVNGETRVRRACATQPEAAGAIGFVAQSVGANELATVFPVGENPACALPSVTLADLGRVVYLSTTPGKASFTPPSSPGLLLQPLGSVVGMVSDAVAIVLVRYEFRFRL